MANESLILNNRSKQVGSMLGYRPSTADAAKPIPIEIPYSRDSDAMEFVNGLWQPVVKNMPRRYNDAWLNEPFATNINARSYQLGTAPWATSNISIDQTSITAPDGTLTGNKITLLSGAPGALERTAQTFTLSAGLTYTLSCFVKAGDFTGDILLRGDVVGNTAGLNYNFTTGVITSSGANVISISKQEVGSNGWVRLILVFTTVLNPNMDINVFNGQQLNKFYYAWGAQLELGSVATSPIITEGAGKDRLADVTAKTNCADIIGQTEGVVYVDVNLQGQSFSDAVAKMLFSISDGTGSNRIEFYRYNNLIYYDCILGGAVQFASNIYTITTFTGQPLKLAISYILNNVKVFINGVLVNTDLASLIPLCNKFNIGSNYTNQSQWNGDIKNSKIYTALLSDAQCIALTTI